MRFGPASAGLFLCPEPTGDTSPILPTIARAAATAPYRLPERQSGTEARREARQTNTGERLETGRARSHPHRSRAGHSPGSRPGTAARSAGHSPCTRSRAAARSARRQHGERAQVPARHRQARERARRGTGRGRGLQGPQGRVRGLQGGTGQGEGRGRAQGRRLHRHRGGVRPPRRVRGRRGEAKGGGAVPVRLFRQEQSTGATRREPPTPRTSARGRCAPTWG